MTALLPLPPSRFLHFQFSKYNQSPFAINQPPPKILFHHNSPVHSNPFSNLDFVSDHWQDAMDEAELRRVFQMFDRNGDGKITKDELNHSLHNLGIFIPDDDLSQMVDNIDANGDGFVDMDEFGSLYRAILDDKDEEEDMREAFNVFDQNGDGFISVEELRSVLQSLGLKQGRSVEDCRKMISRVDRDGDGRVDFSEFKEMMKAGGFGGLG